MTRTRFRDWELSHRGSSLSERKKGELRRFWWQSGTNTRVQNIAIRAGLFVEDIRKMSDRELSSVVLVGPKALSELRRIAGDGEREAGP